MSRTVTRTDQILWLYLMGVKNSDISRRLAVSEQWIAQVLGKCPAVRKRKIVRANLPARFRPAEERAPSRKNSSADRISECVRILKTGSSWNWQEANLKLQDSGLKPAASDLTKFLKMAGFEYNRRTKRWLKT